MRRTNVGRCDNEGESRQADSPPRAACFRVRYFDFAFVETHFPNVPYFVLNATGSAFCSDWQERAALTTACPCAVDVAFAVLETHMPKAFDPSAFVP
jgi:hypothetical protein